MARAVAQPVEGVDELVDDLLSGREISIVRPTPALGDHQELVSRVRAATNGAVLPVVDGSASEGLLNATVGFATVITNDGWLMMPREVVDATPRASVVADGEVVRLTDFVTDSATDIVFARAAGARMRVLNFGGSDRVEDGMQVFIVSSVGMTERTIVDAQWYPGTSITTSSDVFQRFFQLDSEVPLPQGSLVTDGNGSLIGILEGSLQVRPLHHITSALPTVLAAGVVDRPVLGMRVKDSARVWMNEGDLGWLVVDVARSSSAYEAGLRAGDLVVRVNGEETGMMPISEYVLGGAAGSMLDLVVNRDGSDVSISVTL